VPLCDKKHASILILLSPRSFSESLLQLPRPNPSSKEIDLNSQHCRSCGRRFFPSVAFSLNPQILPKMNSSRHSSEDTVQDKLLSNNDQDDQNEYSNHLILATERKGRRRWKIVALVLFGLLLTSIMTNVLQLFKSGRNPIIPYIYCKLPAYPMIQKSES